jgi:4-hydroxybenzoate polyprenyltransferase
MKRLTVPATLLLGAGIALAAALPASAAGGVHVVYSGSVQNLTCTPATYGISAGKVIRDVQNGCDARVWLHGTTGGVNWAFCISPNSSRVPPAPYNMAKNIQVTSNSAGCTPS